VKPPLLWTAALLGALVGSGPARSAPVAQQHRLTNGLDVIVVERRLTPLASIEIAIRHGVQMEPPADSGLAHLLEHMLFRPNRLFPTEERLTARKLDLGIGIFGETEEEVVRFGVTTSAGNVPGATEFLRDMMMSPRLDPMDLDGERLVIGNEIRQRSGAASLRMEKVEQLLFWKHPTRKSDLGQMKNLASFTVADLRRTWERHYTPDNAALIVVGAVEASRVFETAERAFAGWKPAGAASRPPAAVVHPPLPRNQVVVDPVEWPTVTGTFFWQGPSTHGPDAGLARAARILSAVFKRPSPARQHLAERCNAFDLLWLPSSNVGVIQLRWESQPDRTDACLLGVLEELAGVADSYTDDDLKAAFQQTEGEILRSREDPEALAAELAQAWATGDLGDHLDSRAGFQAVGRKDIRRLVERFISGRSFVLNVGLSQARIAGGLDLRHFRSLIGQRRAAGLHP
jgi:zinc protease